MKYTMRGIQRRKEKDRKKARRERKKKIIKCHCYIYCYGRERRTWWSCHSSDYRHNRRRRSRNPRPEAPHLNWSALNREPILQ